MKKIGAKIAIVVGVGIMGASGYMSYNNIEEIKAHEAAATTIDSYMSEYVPSPFNNSAQTKKAPETIVANEATHSFQATETLTFLSYSDEWDEAKLKELYDELLKNKHGDEIEQLKEVVVRAEENDEALASHSQEVDTKSLEVEFGALPSPLKMDFVRDISLIDLYGGDTKTTIESMAWSLSHEYGHLYTFHYMFNDETEDLSGTEYAKLRNYEENGLNPSAYPQDDYYEKHHKYLVETAAEDYVQLMGSPTTRQVVDFKDVKEARNNEEMDQATFDLGYNCRPQENLEIPVASEVEGLKDYFYQQIGEEAPTPVEPHSEMEIKIERQTKGYDLVNGYKSYIYYDLTWNTPYQDTVYTLVCYEPDNYIIMPIKTVQNGEEATATIGEYAYQSGGYIYSRDDGLNKGTKVFVVLAQLSDGTYYASQPLKYTF